MPSGRRHQRMQRPPAGAAEEGRPCPWVLPRPSWATALRLIHLLLLSIGICCLIICGQLWRPKQTQLNPLEVRAETGKQGGKHSGTLEGTGQARGGCAWRLRKSASPGHGKGGKIRTQKVEKGKMKQTEARRSRAGQPGRSQLPGSTRGIPSWERRSLELLR